MEGVHFLDINTTNIFIKVFNRFSFGSFINERLKFKVIELVLPYENWKLLSSQVNNCTRNREFYDFYMAMERHSDIISVNSYDELIETITEFFNE